MQRLQNCAARLLTYTKKTMHITPVLHSLLWLPVHKRITFKICLLVYRTLHKLAPSYLQATLNVYKLSRNLCSSTSQALQLPQVRHTWGEHAFSHVGPKLWNSLPMSLRHTSLKEFKSNLKTYLFFSHSNRNVFFFFVLFFSALFGRHNMSFVYCTYMYNSVKPKTAPRASY